MFFIEISDIYYSESLYSPIDGRIISHEALKAFGIACYCLYYAVIVLMSGSHLPKSFISM